MTGWIVLIALIATGSIMAEVRPYIAVRGGITKTKTQFDPQLIQRNRLTGDFVTMDHTNSGKIKKNNFISDFVLGLSAPIGSDLKFDAEVTYEPQMIKTIKNLSFRGFFANLAPAPGAFEESQATERLKLSRSVGVSFGVRYQVNECHEALGRFGIQHTKLSYQSTLFHRGAFEAQGSMKKRFLRYSGELGWLYHWSNNISSEATIGYQFSKKIKLADLHPQPDIDYFPKFKISQWLVKYGVRYSF